MYIMKNTTDQLKAPVLDIVIIMNNLRAQDHDYCSGIQRMKKLLITPLILLCALSAPVASSAETYTGLAYLDIKTEPNPLETYYRPPAGTLVLGSRLSDANIGMEAEVNMGISTAGGQFGFYKKFGILTISAGAAFQYEASTGTTLYGPATSYRAGKGHYINLQLGPIFVRTQYLHADHNYIGKSPTGLIDAVGTRVNRQVLWLGFVKNFKH